MSADGLELAEGETLVTSWGVSGRSFLIRFAVIAGIWVVIYNFSSLFSDILIFLLSLPLLVLAMAFYMWVFGELDVWFENRSTDWHLTNRAIHILTRDDLPLRLPLNEIRHVNLWPLWSLVVRLQNGTAITLPIPPRPRRLRRTIIATRKAYLEGQTA